MLSLACHMSAQNCAVLVMKRIPTPLCMAMVLYLASSVLQAQDPPSGPLGGGTSSSSGASSPEPSEAEKLLRNSRAGITLDQFAQLDDGDPGLYKAFPNGQASCSAVRDGVKTYLTKQSGKAGAFQSAASNKQALHVLVHVYHFPKENSQEDNEGCWLVAKAKGSGSAISFELLSGNRIYGSSNVWLAALLLGRRGGDASALNVAYWTLVEKKLPANLKNLVAALRLTSTTAQTGGLVVYHALAPIADAAVPSDISVVPTAGKSGGKRAPLVKNPFVVDNEGRHLWDVSVGVPVTKATGLEFAESTSSFTAKEVNKQSLYGLFNVIPFSYSKGAWHWGGDLQNPKDFRPLVLLMGLGVTGRPGERFFVGAGAGVGIVQFFAGSAFVNKEFKDPADATVIRTRYGSQLSFGVNIPVADAVKKLTKK